MTGRMHADEFSVDESLARRLIAGQFPQWSYLPVRRVVPDGTVHAIFRLGDDLAVRIPRVDGRATPRTRESRWLPALAPLLPLEIPLPVAQGLPAGEYPWAWQVHTWVEGLVVPIEQIDAVQAARDLARFVAALREIDPTGAPRGRGEPLAERDADFREWLPTFRGDPAVLAEWERALAAPAWDGPAVWAHGDLDARNWLVRDGRIRAVIDWAAMGVGDPAVDVMVAWKLHSAQARDAFSEALAVDDATWERARGWVISQAVAILAYYTPQNNPVLVAEAEQWLALVLSERLER